MQVSNRGLNVIKEFEGWRPRAYVCPAGHWTIGYGHTAMAGPPTVVAGMVISREEGFAILKRDVAKFAAEVLRLVKVPLTQGQFDALVSFHFNTGALGKSTILKRVNARRFEDVPAQLMRWTRARDPKTGQMVQLQGLVRRRRAEAALWREMSEGPVATRAGRGEVAEVEEAPTETPPAKSWTFRSIVSAIFGGSFMLPFGVDNLWAFLAIAVLLVLLAVVGVMIWTGRLTVAGPADSVPLDTETGTEPIEEGGG
jgi:lysozyme